MSKATKVLSLIAEITIYAFTAIMLIMGVLGLTINEALNSFSISLAVTASMSWYGLAIFAIVTLISAIMAKNEQKLGVKRTFARSIIYMVVIAFCLTFYVIICALVLGLSSIGNELTFMDNFGCFLTLFPFVIILGSTSASCWTNTCSVRQITSDVSMQNPQLKGKKSAMLAGSIIITLLSLVGIAFIFYIGLDLVLA